MQCPDFSAPETAGRSFLAAIACDADVAAYLCLSEGLKEQHAATLDGFLLFKSELEREYGRALGYAARLQPLGPAEDAGGRVRIWWGLRGEPVLGLDFEPQYYLDLTTHSGSRAGEFLERPPGTLLHWDGGRLSLEAPPALAQRFPDLSGIRRLDLGTEWKIRDVLAPPQP